jgi:hypothetical protein
MIMRQIDAYTTNNHSKGITSKILMIMTAILLVFASDRLHAAEYQGRDVDGETFSCTAFSYSTGRYYYGQVEFDGDEATFYFQNGGHISLTIDDEEIEEPDSISAFDYSNGVYWELDVDDL